MASERRYEFVACPGCGKERQVSHTEDAAADAYFRLMQVCSCKACEAEINKTMDRCPEGVHSPNYSSACRLTWGHKGRCEPFDLPRVGGEGSVSDDNG